jgi:hypothetical protein
MDQSKKGIDVDSIIEKLLLVKGYVFLIIQEKSWDRSETIRKRNNILNKIDNKNLF